MNSFKKLTVLSVILIAVAGCNTIAGAGKDVESGGQKVQEVAKDTQKKL